MPTSQARADGRIYPTLQVAQQTLGIQNPAGRATPAWLNQAHNKQAGP